MYENKYLKFNLTIFALSYFTFYYSVRKLSHLISRNFKTYNDLTNRNKLEWNDKVNATIHAIFCCAFGLLAIKYDDIGYNDPVWGQHMLSGLSMSFTVGYIFSDIVYMYLYLEDDSAHYSGMYIHHFATLIMLGWCMIFGHWWYVWVIRSFAESSTPFLSLRVTLKMLGKKDSTLAYYNNWMFAISFFICRIAMLPVVYAMAYPIWDTPTMNRMYPIKWCGFFGAVILDILNVYWFGIVLRGMYNHFNLKKTDKDE